MIVFDLACGHGHVFEAWFGSSADFEDQRGRGLVACPICGATVVDKAAMAPAVGSKSNRTDGGSTAIAMRGGTLAPAERKAMLAALAKAQAKILEGSEHVGARFADEARAIHDGDAPERAIHGQATRDEAKALLADGVQVAPLPLPITPPGTAH